MINSVDLLNIYEQENDFVLLDSIDDFNDLNNYLDKFDTQDELVNKKLLIDILENNNLNQ